MTIKTRNRTAHRINRRGMVIVAPGLEYFGGEGDHEIEAGCGDAVSRENIATLPADSTVVKTESFCEIETNREARDGESNAAAESK